MMQITFLGRADNWGRKLCQECSARVSILGLKALEGRGVAHFVDIVAETEEGRSRVLNWLHSSREVRETELTELGKGRLMGTVVTKGCKICASFVRSDLASFFSGATTEVDHAVCYTLFLNNDDVPKLLNRLSSTGAGYEVMEISALERDGELTARQLAVLKSAVEMGLFDFPRGITQDDLADRLGMNSSTLNEILRRAERKILRSFLRRTSGTQPQPLPHTQSR